MDKIDLIIDALEDAVHNFAGDDTESKCIAALAAARELKALKPEQLGKMLITALRLDDEVKHD